MVLAEHMFQQVADLIGGVMEARTAPTRTVPHDAFHVVFGVEGVSRDDFDPYVPSKRRASLTTSLLIYTRRRTPFCKLVI